MTEFMTELRNTLIECYTTIINGVNSFHSQTILAKFAPSIIIFLS
jgi:hypothetical protein